MDYNTNPVDCIPLQLRLQLPLYSSFSRHDSLSSVVLLYSSSAYTTVAAVQCSSSSIGGWMTILDDDCRWRVSFTINSLLQVILLPEGPTKKSPLNQA